MSAANIALNRFGLGARPEDVTGSRPAEWLLAQFDRFEPRPAAIAGCPTRAQVAGELAEYLTELRPQLRAQARNETPAASAAAPPPRAPAGTPGQAAPPAPTDPVKTAQQFARRQGRDFYAAMVGARAATALTTEAPFVERLAHFWANHFAVSADKLQVIGLAGLLEFEAIRSHVLGRFSDMLGAVERHPAMLLYLDQATSIGPDSPLAARVARFAQRRSLGLNENLAREILELHTLGVRTGYSQGDVTEFARALTGWTVAGLARGPLARALPEGGAPGDFVFASALHQPGARTILGTSFNQPGEAQAQAVLEMLATHPATARHIATKLARHFAGDTPPPAMVARLEGAFLRSGGDLPTVYRALVASPEAWEAAPAKFRSPWEWSIAALRAVGAREAPAQMFVTMMNELGQPVWRPGSPAGYDDIAGAWAAPDALMRRVEVAGRIAARTGGTVDARALAPRIFPETLGSATANALAQAASPVQALALLLVAPEMLRR